VLRALLRRRAALPPGSPPWQGLPQLEGEQPAATILGLRHSLPAWLAELLLLWLPPQRAEAFAASCNQPPSLDLRVNPLRASRDQVLVALRQAGAAAEPLAEPQAIGLSGRVGDPRQLPGYAEGQWCVQDRSAQRIAPLLQPQPGQLILDACAAPGGKSTHLAELLGDQGEIWAVDRSEARLRRLQRNAERLGLAAIHTLAADAGQLAGQRPEWLGQVDRILLDAPCSGLGTLARHADARWRIDPGAITELVALQQQLLEALLPLLKPTGLLVYATCTVHPAENGELIAALLARHPQLHLRSTQQWWPGESAGDGFYAAVLANAPAEGAG
jgi:16S rRNA (cytosine967-C5)-methyltransferase